MKKTLLFQSCGDNGFKQLSGLTRPSTQSNIESLEIYPHLKNHTHPSNKDVGGWDVKLGFTKCQRTQLSKPTQAGKQSD